MANSIPGVPLARLLPPFRLEVFFERWEFTARYHLTASDAETMSIHELLELADRDHAELGALRLSYGPVEGSAELRQAIAATYVELEPDEVLCFAGAEEAIFWTMQVLLGPGDHAVVAAPSYQSMESVAIATGAEITGLPLWTGTGADLRWTLDLDRLQAALRPNTAVVAVNFPHNPSGFVPDHTTYAALVTMCDERGIRLINDEVYRGLELDPARTIGQAADLSARGVSVNVMSKAYGLPGLRVGWVACRDRDLLGRLRRAKHYTSICNAVPSEWLATLALQQGDGIRARNRMIIESNLPVFADFFAEFQDRFDWQPPDGGCVAFPRYRGVDGVEAFCQRAVEERGVLLLPASVYASELVDVPTDRFRVGVGRRDPGPALEQLAAIL